MNTPKVIAGGALWTGVTAVFSLIILAGCSALPAAPAQPQAALPPLALATVDSAGLPEGSTAVHYRLAYADAQQLRPYQAARWSQPPIQLVRQSLQARLGQRRTIIGVAGTLAGARANGQPPAVLRVELEEFSQVFASAQHSAGLVRLRATLTQPSALGENLLAQRLFIVRQPATRPDAQGGAQALAQAAEQVAREVADWLELVGR